MTDQQYFILNQGISIYFPYYFILLFCASMTTLCYGVILQTSKIYSKGVANHVGNDHNEYSHEYYDLCA